MLKPYSLIHPYLEFLLDLWGFWEDFLSFSWENYWSTTMSSSSSWSCFGDSQSNLQRFLQCATPVIPSQPLPQVFLFLNILFIYYPIYFYFFKFFICSISVWMLKLTTFSFFFFVLSIHGTMCVFVWLCLFIFYFF